ncbi:MAG: phage terminase large subunit [Prevotella sp.]
MTPGKYGGKIHPYTLGVLLGDGSTTIPKSISVTTDDQEIFDHIVADGYDVQWRNRYVNKTPSFGFRHCPELHEYLKQHHLNCRAETKYIPNGYKFAPQDVRLAILQGLMDTDGYADNRGHCEFCSVSQQLAEDVQWLVRSLGGKATIREKEAFCTFEDGRRVQGQNAFIVYIQSKDNSTLFRLTRKKERCLGKPYNGGVSELCRRIISIEPCGEEECQCILLDDPRHLYVTKDFVVTHNTHVLRLKALGGALKYAKIRILIIRREYPELEQTVILPMRTMVPQEIASYNATMHMFFFVNGSTIKFGHYGSGDDLEYQGQEYDWIFIDEATQFTEAQFRTLGACLRGSTKIPRRMYLTCNPGGVGHLWVKRLFVEREYRDGENPKDYTFIPATVEDNPQLMENSPDYINMLDLQPDDVKRAWRYGDWDALAGTFFPEFRKETHVITPFVRVPTEWKKYRAFDYGLDMFACLWIAQDFEGRSYVYREVQQKNLIVSDAAKLMLDLTPEREHIEFTIAPPDMWNRQKDSGRNMADLYAENGVGILRASNNRIQGWMAVKEMLKPMRSDKDKPGLLVTEDCVGLIRNLPAIQHDDKNPSDCATEPHDITHITDACRYYCVTRTLGAEMDVTRNDDSFDIADKDYDEEMTGGDIDDSYLTYGGE